MAYYFLKDIIRLKLGKSDHINKLNKRVLGCVQCRLHETRKNAVPGEGNIQSDLMIIGQAPGKEEDREGKMFLGPSGEILDRLFTDLGLTRKEFYMTNMLKCFLPKSRKPRQDEIDTCIQLYLFNEINLVNPKVLIPLGYHCTKMIFRRYNLPVPDRHHFPELFGKMFVAKNRKILPLRHPATVVHNSAIYEKLLSNYRKINIITKVCSWFHVCPIKNFFDQGKLPKEWIDKYCKGDWTACIRYQLEEKYIPHADNLLPDGHYDNNLS